MDVGLVSPAEVDWASRTFGHHCPQSMIEPACGWIIVALERTSVSLSSCSKQTEPRNPSDPVRRTLLPRVCSLTENIESMLMM